MGIWRPSLSFFCWYMTVNHARVVVIPQRKDPICCANIYIWAFISSPRQPAVNLPVSHVQHLSISARCEAGVSIPLHHDYRLTPPACGTTVYSCAPPTSPPLVRHSSGCRKFRRETPIPISAYNRSVSASHVISNRLPARSLQLPHTMIRRIFHINFSYSLFCNLFIS